MAALTESYLDLVNGKTAGLGADLARGALCLAKAPYAAAIAARNALYDRRWLTVHRASVPVVSVGNLTAGGTGKTPCVEYLGRFYRDRDVQVAILSRGYGSDSGPNDEALVLEANLDDVPHLQGPDRVALANTAIEELESELLILDDGFQHRRLARDLDIVLIDTTNPWGHGHLLPRGLMREPKSALRRAGAVILTRCDQASTDQLASVRHEVLRRVRAGTPVVESVHQPIAWLQESQPDQPIDRFHGQPVGAFCGIGHPEAFRKTLASLGVSPLEFREFPDHHGYTRADIDDLREWADRLPPDGVVLTTQKDAVKIRLADLAGWPLYALRVGLVPRPGPELDALHERLISVEKNPNHKGTET